MQANELIGAILTPPQNQKKLAFCAGSKKQAVVEWSQLLRPTQVEKTSLMLYEALPELPRLITPTSSRLEMLELLRPFVQHAAKGLTKHYLNGPLSLTSSAQKSAIVSQALQKHMIDGYIVCAKELIRNKKTKPGDRDLGLCLHRAVTGIGLLFLRTYQIYAQTPKHLWQAMHTLFRVADIYELLDAPFTDEEQQTAKVCSIQDMYLTSVLLDSVRPHQLGQQDIASVYDTFRNWSRFVRFNIGLTDDPDHFFCIDLNSEEGPIYKTRITDRDQSDIIELDFSPIVGQLAKQREESDTSVESMGSSAIEVPKSITPPIFDHLLEAWGNIAQRKQERRKVQTTADFCVGIFDCHFHLSDSTSFEDFVEQAGDSEDSETNNTILSGFTPRESSTISRGESENQVCKVEIQNTSQGGFCINWNNTNAIKVQAGNMVGLREFGKKHWCIGVVRWIRQKKKHSQLGIRIISDKAEPYAVAQAYDMGGYSDYMRAFYLPQDPFAKMPASLLVAGSPLQAKDKVRIRDGNDEYGAKLDERLFGTSNLQRFSFHDLEGRVPKAPNKSSFSNW